MKQVKLHRGRTEFPFKATKGPQSKYPWDKWLDGNLNQISAGEDFELERDQMVGKLRGAARRRFKVVSISKLDQDDKPLENALVIQARDMTPEEKESERARRAGRKAKKAEKRSAKKKAAAEAAVGAGG